MSVYRCCCCSGTLCWCCLSLLRIPPDPLLLIGRNIGIGLRQLPSCPAQTLAHTLGVVGDVVKATHTHTLFQIHIFRDFYDIYLLLHKCTQHNLHTTKKAFRINKVRPQILCWPHHKIMIWGEGGLSFTYRDPTNNILRSRALTSPFSSFRMMWIFRMFQNWSSLPRIPDVFQHFQYGK